MSFEVRLFELVPAYLNRQEYIAVSFYNDEWDDFHRPKYSDTYKNEFTKDEIEASLRESWEDANACTNEAQNPERWFEHQIFLVMDGWKRDPPTRLKAITDFMETVCRIMESVDTNVGKSRLTLKEKVNARQVRRNYIARNWDAYPRPNTNDELFMTVTAILQKV